MLTIPIGFGFALVLVQAFAPARLPPYPSPSPYDVMHVFRSVSKYGFLGCIFSFLLSEFRLALVASHIEDFCI